MIKLYNSSRKSPAMIVVKFNGENKNYHVPPRQTASFPDSAKIVSKPSTVTIVDQSKKVTVVEKPPVDEEKPSSNKQEQNGGAKGNKDSLSGQETGGKK